MKRLLLSLLTLLTLLSTAPLVQAQSALATFADAMTPGTWAQFTSPTGMTSGMIYPGNNGGVDYAIHGLWDSTHHKGYFWGAAHSSDSICYPGISMFTWAGTATGSGSLTNVPAFSTNSVNGTNATFDISWSGGVYTPTINNHGGQYLNGHDTLLFKGSTFGGMDGTHDLTITVTEALYPVDQVACADDSEFFQIRRCDERVFIRR